METGSGDAGGAQADVVARPSRQAGPQSNKGRRVRQRGAVQGRQQNLAV